MTCIVFKLFELDTRVKCYCYLWWSVVLLVSLALESGVWNKFVWPTRRSPRTVCDLVKCKLGLCCYHNSWEPETFSKIVSVVFDKRKGIQVIMEVVCPIEEASNILCPLMKLDHIPNPTLFLNRRLAGMYHRLSLVSKSESN